MGISGHKLGIMAIVTLPLVPQLKKELHGGKRGD